MMKTTMMSMWRGRPLRPQASHSESLESSWMMTMILSMRRLLSLPKTTLWILVRKSLPFFDCGSLPVKDCTGTDDTHMDTIDEAGLDDSLLDDDIEVVSSLAQSKSKPAQSKPKPTTPFKPAVAAVVNVSLICRQGRWLLI